MMTRLRQSLRIVSNSSAAGQQRGEVLADHDSVPDSSTVPSPEPPRTFDMIGSAAADLALALTAAEWERIKDSDDINRLFRFAAYFPGYYSELAYERVHVLQNKLREDSNWLWAEDQGTAAAYLRYLAAWPDGRYVRTAQIRLVKLELATGSFVPGLPMMGGSAGNPALATSSGGGTSQSVAANRRHDNGAATQGQVFRDGQNMPELVVVAAGSFLMGAEDDNGRLFELPVRSVTIHDHLAVGRFQVTFAEWDHAVRNGALAYKPDDEGWGRGRRPVVNVSWHEAKLYTAWLSQVTGHDYRLLTEAEWEYCCRAGSREAYATGANITPAQARFSAREWGEAGQTAEVGSFEPNPFGLFDMHGNVSEWVEDDWTSAYGAAGCDGSAVKAEAPSAKITRGGGWPDLAGSLRSAGRNRLNPKTRNNGTGFRVARKATNAG